MRCCRPATRSPSTCSIASCWKGRPPLPRCRHRASRDGNGDLADDAHETGRRHWTLRVPWLLLAAILLAAALSGLLLLFGAR
jgi:hypothetical protein